MNDVVSVGDSNGVDWRDGINEIDDVFYKEIWNNSVHGSGDCNPYVDVVDNDNDNSCSGNDSSDDDGDGREGGRRR